MKKILKMFTFYNKSANEKLIQILVGLTADQIKKDLNGFYHSILGTFQHILKTDIMWLKRLRKSFPAIACLSEDNIPDLKTVENEDYKELFPVRRKLDEIFESFSGEIQEKDLESVISYANMKGDKIEKELWLCLIHLFNHQTHHRGQIAVMLDMIGVQNDYSGILNYL